MHLIIKLVTLIKTNLNFKKNVKNCFDKKDACFVACLFVSDNNLIVLFIYFQKSKKEFSMNTSRKQFLQQRSNRL